MNLLKTFAVLSGLSGTDRFSNAKLIHRESVLEHLGSVALMCYLIAVELRIDNALVASTLSKAVVHDVEELLTGDVPRSTKYSSGAVRESFRVIEQRAVNNILYDIDIDSKTRVFTDYIEAKQNLSGLIVKLVDSLAVVYKIQEETVERGNRTMLSRSSSCISQLVEIRDIVVGDDMLDPAQKTFIFDLIDQAFAVIAMAQKLTVDNFIEEKT